MSGFLLESDFRTVPDNFLGLELTTTPLLWSNVAEPRGVSSSPAETNAAGNLLVRVTDPTVGGANVGLVGLGPRLGSDVGAGLGLCRMLARSGLLT